MPDLPNRHVPDRIRALGVPRVEEYFGVWAVLDDRFRAMVQRANQIDLTAHVRDQAQQRADWADGDGPDLAYLVDGSVAIIELCGPLTKYGSSLASGTSMALARRMVRLAANDDAITAIVLRIDSPGGTVSGTDDLAQDVAAAAGRKPVAAYIEDLAASGAYWVASQASKIYANRSALVGSIGSYATLVDSSGAAEKEGLKVHVIRSAEFKGAEVAGVEIADETLAEWQRVVDGSHDRFVRAVAAGRKLSLARTRELADGRVHFAAEARELGLIDEIRAFDDVVAALNKPKRNRTPQNSQGARAMSEPTTIESAAAILQPQQVAPRAATLQELRAELAGADANFVLAQLEANATLPQASKAWIGELTARNQAAAEKAAAAETKLAEVEKTRAAATTRPGVDPLPSGSASAADSAGGDAIAAWNAIVEAEIKALGPDASRRPKSLTVPTARGRATLAAAQKHPEAHAAYLAAYNAEHRKRFKPRHAMPLNENAHIAAVAA